MPTIINAGQTALTITPDTTGALTLQANGTNALQITANGQITTANAPFILTGGRIQFPSTAILSGDGNCLDDYEEGTWNPTWEGSASNPTVTYDINRFGKYTKIGNVVFISARVGISTIAGGSGNANIGGLPFTVSNDNAYPAFPLGYKTNFNTNGPDWARFFSNSTYAAVFYDANTNESALTISNLQNGVDCLFTGFYYTS